jgi:hypothetical protein
MTVHAPWMHVTNAVSHTRLGPRGFHLRHFQEQSSLISGSQNSNGLCWVLIGKQHEGTIWVDGNVLCLHLGLKINTEWENWFHLMTAQLSVYTGFASCIVLL